MPIEFNCGQCGQRLRVPDTSAGKKAKCPKCEQVLEVPTAAATPSPGAAAAAPTSANPFGDAPARTGPVNPFESPTAPFEDQTATPQGAISTGTLDAGFALSTAWEMFKPNIGILLGAVVVQMVLSFVLQIVFGLLQTAVIQSTGNPGGPEAIGIQVIGFLVQQAANIFLAIGIIRICLKVARNQHPEFSELFSGGKYFLRAVGGGIVFALMMIVGFALLIIPGIYLALKYLPYIYFIVDRDCSIGESFRLAGEVTNGNKLQLFLLGFIGMGLGILGFLALCVGIFPAIAVSNMMWTVAYLMMSSQPLMRPTPQQTT